MSSETRGTAFVVYHDIFDAKAALEKLNGFQVAKRYLIVHYYQQHKAKEQQAQEMEKRRSQMAGRLI